MAIKFVIAAGSIIILAWYALWGRDWLKNKPWTAGFFARVEPIEIVLFKKSQTILLARLKMTVGVTLTALTYLGTIDLTPLMPFVPEQYQGLVHLAFNLLPMIITLMGMADEKLRNKTTAPLELVAIPEKDKARPEIAEAIAIADSTRVEAVAAVKQANGAQP
jgi:hypothetical protein